MNKTLLHIGLLAICAITPISTASQVADTVSAMPSPESLLFAIEDADDKLPDAEEEKPKSPWSGSVSLSLSGNSGTNITFNFRFNAQVRRVTPMEIFTANLSYFLAYDSGVLTDNNGLLDASQTWNISANSPWNIWIQGSYQYDENEGYKTRLTGYGGAGYRVVNKDDLKINLKAGFGAQWDYRGNTGVQPQSILEIDCMWAIMDGIKFTSNASIANDVRNLGSYLVRARAQLEVAIKAVKGLALTAGIRDEYDSTPAVGSSFNQVWYWVGIQYNF